MTTCLFSKLIYNLGYETVLLGDYKLAVPYSMKKVKKARTVQSLWQIATE